MSRGRSRLLVITTSFAPERAIGAVRVSRFVKYLVRLGYDITVVSPALPADTPLDTSLEAPELDRARRITVAQSPWFDALFSGPRRKMLAGASAARLITSSTNDRLATRVKAAVARYFQFAYTVVRNVDWSRRVVRTLQRDGEGFDVVLSSYPSLGAMWAAGRTRRNGVVKRWIADFRDPVNYSDSSAFVHWANSAIQSRILAGADAVMTVSEGVARKLEEGGALECVVVPNGYDPEDLLPSAPSPERSGSTARFCYTGSLHGGRRDLSPLFAAFDRLHRERRITPDGFVVEYAGKDFQILRRQAEQYGLEDRLVDHGFVSRETSIALQQQADALVVATWNTRSDQGIMSGKLFECFLLRKPVIGLVSGDLPDSELKSVLSDVGGGVAFETVRPEGFEELVAFVEAICACAQSGREWASSYGPAVERYAYPRLTRDVAALIEAR